MQEQGSPDSLVEVGARPPEVLELLAGMQFLVHAGRRDQLADRAVPYRRIGVGDRLDEELANWRPARGSRLMGRQGVQTSGWAEPAVNGGYSVPPGRPIPGEVRG